MGATEMNKLAANIIDLPSPKKEHAPALLLLTFAFPMCTVFTVVNETDLLQSHVRFLLRSNIN